MDVSRPISYRGIALNDAVAGGGFENMHGVAVERIDYSAVPGFGYIEKRSQQDGYDAGDIFLGKRDISLAGTIYGRTRADVFDRLEQLRAAFTPSGAYAADPASYGYLPLTFEEPTLRVTDFPSGYIPKQMNVRPRSTPQFVVTRDSSGGKDARGLAIPWSVELEARDPRIYHQSAIVMPFAGGSAGVFYFLNRGSYPAPLLINLYADPSTPAYEMTFSGFGSVLKLSMPSTPYARELRYDGYERYAFLEQQGLTTLRMDLMVLLNDTPHPQVPPGSHTATWSSVGASVHGDSILTYREAWA